jgi:ankyrin repeat protein
MKKLVIAILIIFSSNSWAKDYDEMLHNALVDRKHEFAVEALHNGANPNISIKANGGTYSAIIVATENGNFELAKTLIEYGADINSVDNKGLDAMTYALCKGGQYRIKIAELLLENGVRLDRRYLNSYSLAGLINAKCGNDGKEFLQRHNITR